MSCHRYGEALACYRTVLFLHPEYPHAEASLAKCLLNLGHLEEAYEAFTKTMVSHGAGRSDVSGYLMSSLYSPRHTPERLLAEHQTLTRPWVDGIRPIRQQRKKRSGPLRVGYLTADLQGTHPVAQFVAPILHAHRHLGIESHVYLNASPAETGSANISQVADLKVVEDLSDIELARRIADDSLDILVDLSGHSQGTRLPILAYRPAPIQASFIGYPHSTGFEPVDYLIADPVVCPPETEHLCSERVARLPNCFLCFVPPAEMPKPWPRPSSRQIVFGSLNHLPKMGQGTIELWAKVLQAVPKSLLFVKCAAFTEPKTCEVYRNRFEELGIAADRLDFHGPSGFKEAMMAYNRIDIVLDTIPYNGGTTSCHALWMGVPVVTLVGRNYCGRMGASILAAAGFPELVAETEEAFVEIASGLAKDRDRLIELRRAISEAVSKSALCNIDSYAHDLFSLYRRIIAA